MWKSVWGCGKLSVRCGKLCATGEGVKIIRKIISKRFGGVECLFYFCGVQTKKTYQWSSNLIGLRPW